MKAVILAAGYATRLYPLTLDKPKALLPISGKPILNYIIEKLEKIKEVDEIFILSNDRFYMNFVWWLNQNAFSKKVEVMNDGTSSNETRLGGIGDLWFAIQNKKINDDVLVISGDNLFDFNIQEMIDYFKNLNKTLIGIYDINDIEEVKKMSIVELKDGKLIAFEEKPQNPKVTLSSIGIYIYTKEDLKKIKEYMKTDKPKDGPGFLVQDFCKNSDVYSFVFKGRWFDIGSKETYDKVNNSWRE